MKFQDPDPGDVAGGADEAAGGFIPRMTLKPLWMAFPHRCGWSDCRNFSFEEDIFGENIYLDLGGDFGVGEFIYKSKYLG